jgi:hypothetical protein
MRVSSPVNHRVSFCRGMSAIVLESDPSVREPRRFLR